MTRKKKTKTSLSIVKFILPVLLSLFFVLIVCRSAYLFLTNSERFVIKSITVDPSLHFIKTSDLSRLKGKNIFAIDLKGIQKRLAFRYPQVSRLRIVRHFPDEISVVAKERPPYAQVFIDDKIVTIDKEGIILSLMNKRHHTLPFIRGVPGGRQKLALGFSLSGHEIRSALRILRIFDETPALSVYPVQAVSVKNLSQIEAVLSNKIRIYFDRYNIEKKANVLSFMLTERRIDLNETKYIDLRFKEPVIGQKKKI